MAKTTLTIQIDAVKEAVISGVQQILHDNIEEFKKAVSEEVHSSVYPLYSPMDYERRGDGGGLSDVGNYEVIEGNLSLTLTNRTMSNPNYWRHSYSIPITEVVEDGSGYGWEGVPSRPFMDKALEKFANDTIVPQIEALLGGM